MRSAYALMLFTMLFASVFAEQMKFKFLEGTDLPAGSKITLTIDYEQSSSYPQTYKLTFLTPNKIEATNTFKSKNESKITLSRQYGNPRGLDKVIIDILENYKTLDFNGGVLCYYATNGKKLCMSHV